MDLRLCTVIFIACRMRTLVISKSSTTYMDTAKQVAVCSFAEKNHGTLMFVKKKVSAGQYRLALMKIAHKQQLKCRSTYKASTL